VFEPFSVAALDHAVTRALDAHADRPLWTALVRQVMQRDWSWEASGRAYLQLYEWMRGRPPVPVR
jgi:starch synthase